MLLGIVAICVALILLQVGLRQKDDPTLARRMQERDPRVMGDLYDRYGRLAYTVILRIVRNSGTAEDLVQETFLRIWNRSAAFDPERGALGPWILTVARNRAIDHVRTLEARAEIVDLDRLDRPGSFQGLEDSALSIDRARRLESALARLTPQQRSVIEMAYYEGLSQTEMAARMKQPLGTVKTWVRAALKIMRDELSDEAAATA